ncbi:MAG: dephospho-CoA kinase [Burkholderiales bacterium]|nr:dephospho-CoA kinase [Burkholderiales bacterium]
MTATEAESFEQAPRRPLIGVTGGIGSGKSTVADMFAARGVTLVDADAIAHALTAPGGAAMPIVRERFGAHVVRPDGALDRDAMRELVFRDPGKRHELESILHPMIHDESRRQIEAASGVYTMLVVPLLIESGNWRSRVERVLVVDCPVEVQIERVMRRNGLARERIESIIAAQASRQQRLAAADDVVDNGGSTETLPAQVQALHQRYLAMRP